MADTWGIAISFACAIHCLTLPFVAVVSPLLSKFISSPFIHIGLFVTLLPISFIAFIRQKRKHQKSSPSILAGIGLMLLFIGLSFSLEHGHDNLDFHLEDFISILGSLLLITAHILNIKHLKNCRQCCHS